MDRNVECLSVEKKCSMQQERFFVALVYRSHFFTNLVATGFQSDADFFSISRFCADFLVFGWVNLWMWLLCMQRIFVQGPRSTKFVELKKLKLLRLFLKWNSLLKVNVWADCNHEMYDLQLKGIQLQSSKIFDEIQVICFWIDSPKFFFHTRWSIRLPFHHNCHVYEFFIEPKTLTEPKAPFLSLRLVFHEHLW